MPYKRSKFANVADLQHNVLHGLFDQLILDGEVKNVPLILLLNQLQSLEHQLWQASWCSPKIFRTNGLINDVIIVTLPPYSRKMTSFFRLRYERFKFCT